MSEIAVVIATRGRPAMAARLAQALRMQSRPPDHIFIIGAGPEDIAALPADNPGLTAAVARPGLTLQRNEGVRLAGGAYQFLVFFDDDFWPSIRWLENMQAILGVNTDIVGLTGRVLADGVGGPGIDMATAQALVAARDAAPDGPANFDESFGPYGCNMAFRASAMEGLPFDERLPLYGWLEDADFGERIRARGRMGRVDNLWGVHLGAKSGREKGRRLGYSQVANAIYLSRKGSLSWRFTGKRVAGNLIANAARAFHPESHIDRRGRFAGNLIALWETLLGVAAPERAARL